MIFLVPSGLSGKKKNEIKPQGHEVTKISPGMRGYRNKNTIKVNSEDQDYFTMLSRYDVSWKQKKRWVAGFKFYFFLLVVW